MMFQFSLDEYEKSVRDMAFWQDLIKKQLAYDIDCYMKDNGVTATALAEQLGVTLNYVSHMHKGRVFPSIDLMRRLATIINNASG